MIERRWLRWGFGSASLALVAIASHAQIEPKAREYAVSEYKVADIFFNLRSQILQLGLTDKTHSPNDLVAVLMETGYPEAIATLAAVSDGTVSLYFSNGGGVVGAGEHEVVRNIGRGFLSLAAEFVSQASASDTQPLPAVGHVRFYFVTPGGIYTVDAPEDDLGYNRHQLSPLFHEGHELISAIREHMPQ